MSKFNLSSLKFTVLIERNSINKYTNGDEIANALTHAVGVFLFLIGSVALVLKAYGSHDFWKIFSAYIFGGSLMLLYLSSTLYHMISSSRVKGFFRLIDHSAIFILIAGTYTPFLLVTLRDKVDISFIIIMWSIAIGGIIYKIFMIKRSKLISTLIYLAMGWMAVFKLESFYRALPIQASIWILVGGVFYSLGTIFYSKEKINFHHAIWHLFVLCGSASHFIAIYFYVY